MWTVRIEDRFKDLFELTVSDIPYVSDTQKRKKQRFNLSDIIAIYYNQGLDLSVKKERELAASVYKKRSVDIWIKENRDRPDNMCSFVYY